MVKQQLGTRIRELRTSKGYSQESFSRVSGIDRTYIASVEAGKRNISLENIVKIANSLNVSLVELFNFTMPIHRTMIITINGKNWNSESIHSH